MPNNPQIDFSPGNEHNGSSENDLVIGGENRPKVSVSGSDSNLSKNSENAGSNIVSFHKNANVFFENVSDDDYIKIQSVKVSDSVNTKNVVIDSSSGQVLEGTVTPKHMTISYESGIPTQKKFIVKLSTELARNAEVAVELFTQFDGPSILEDDFTYGIFGAFERSPNNPSSFVVTYIPPIDKPAEFSKVLAKFVVTSEIESNGESVAFTRTLYAIIKFVLFVDYSPFVFNEDTAKTDSINGDYYCGTTNRGLAIFDASLATVDTIDRNDGLFISELNVRCAIRLAAQDNSNVGGILLATATGLIYFNSPPYSNPISPGPKNKISSIAVKDMVISGQNLFMLGNSGIVYRIHYEKVLARIANNQGIEDLMLLAEHQPFSFSGELAQPYNPATVPDKILPTKFSTWLNDGNGQTLAETVDKIHSEPIPDSYGIKVFYTELITNKKSMMSVVYAPSYLKPAIVPGTDFDDGESTWTKFYNFTYLETTGDSSSQQYDSQINDYPEVTILRNAVLQDNLQYCDFYIRASKLKRSTNRVLTLSVGNPVATLDSTKNYLCPRNIDILAILPWGENLIKINKADGSFLLIYDKESYDPPDSLRLGEYDKFETQVAFNESLDAKLREIRRNMFPFMARTTDIDIFDIKVAISFYADEACTILLTRPTSVPASITLWVSGTTWSNPGCPPGTLVNEMPVISGYSTYYIKSRVTVLHSYYTYIDGVFTYVNMMNIDPNAYGTATFKADSTYEFDILTPITRVAKAKVEDMSTITYEPTGTKFYYFGTTANQEVAFVNGGILKLQLGSTTNKFGNFKETIKYILNQAPHNIANPVISSVKVETSYYPNDANPVTPIESVRTFYDSSINNDNDIMGNLLVNPLPSHGSSYEAETQFTVFLSGVASGPGSPGNGITVSVFDGLNSSATVTSLIYIDDILYYKERSNEIPPSPIVLYVNEQFNPSVAAPIMLENFPATVEYPVGSWGALYDEVSGRMQFVLNYITFKPKLFKFENNQMNLTAFTLPEKQFDVSLQMSNNSTGSYNPVINEDMRSYVDTSVDFKTGLYYIRIDCDVTVSEGGPNPLYLTYMNDGTYEEFVQLNEYI